jgi:hypothetical protein
MGQARYRIGTVTFSDESCPTWRSRSNQVLDHMTRWAQEGWRISRLHTARVRLHAPGFCLLLERPAVEAARPKAGRKHRPRWHEAA